MKKIWVVLTTTSTLIEAKGNLSDRSMKTVRRVEEMGNFFHVN